MGDEERVLAVYRHHWFAYASIFFIALFASLVIVGFAAMIVGQGDTNNPVSQYQTVIISGSLVFAAVILFASLLPIWLRMQEKLILSDEAIYQMLQPNLFSSKISQLNLAHINDVTSKQDFFGTMFGFGHLTVETPGEQDNYEFSVLANVRQAAKEIIEAHENFQAALESGRITTSFRGQPAVTTSGPQAPTYIDPQEYQQFLAFQRMQQEQAAQNAQPANTPAPQDTSPDNK